MLSIYIKLLITISTSILVSCIMIPYTPNSDIVQLERKISKDTPVSLTIGPRRFLEEMANEMIEREERIEILPALLFRDTVFPTGDWTFAALFSPESRERIKDTAAEYLIAFGPMNYKEDYSHDWMDRSIGFWGIANVKSERNISAVIIDLEQSCFLVSFTVECEASTLGVGWLIGFFIVPETRRSVVKFLADGLVKNLADAKTTGTIRVVLMAAESTAIDENPLSKQ